MPHLSLLWNKPLAQCADIPEIIPMQTLEDVILAKDFKRDTLSLMRKPCSPEEISMRQPVIRMAWENDGFRELLGEIHEKIRDLSRLL